jgi:hypothetical protein
MKSYYFTFAFTLFFTIGLFAQRKVALQHNGVTTIFSGTQPYVDAVNAAVDGDTIYLPGGQLTSPSAYNKRLTIYGAGLRADTSVVTQKTQISTFSLLAGADNFHLEGVQVNGSITLLNNTKIDSVLLKRIRVTANITVSGTNQDCDGFRIQESIIQGTVNLQNTTSPEITNSILNFVSNLENGYIGNNILMNTSSLSTRILTNVNQCLIENNYIGNLYISSYLLSNCSNNSFVSNAFNTNPTADATNDWINNYLNLAPGSLFIDYSWPFTEAANYNLQNPTSFQGTTGNEIGLYGGLFPAKEGFIPQNPHFQFKNIANQTNTAGELQIEITVEAQNE